MGAGAEAVSMFKQGRLGMPAPPIVAGKSDDKPPQADAPEMDGEEDEQEDWSEFATENKSTDNPVSPAHNVRLNHKNEKHIGALRAIPADIDVEKISDATGENFRAKRAGLVQKVAPTLTRNLGCPPSFLVDSGGGLQPWFILEESVEATPENVELNSGIGRAIQRRYAELVGNGFKVDYVADAARIMRLPGTINIPDKEKKAEGRSPTLATVLVEHSSGKRCSLDQLRAWAPPIPEKESASSKDEKLPKIHMDLVRSANTYEELPTELRENFERVCDETRDLQELWSGTPSPWQRDLSGSGYAHALACLLKGADVFSPTEFGQLIWVWDHASALEKRDARYIARAWANATPIGGSSGLERVEIDESKEKPAALTGTENVNEKPAWDEPTDLWAGKSEPTDLPSGVVPKIVERFARDRGRRLGVEPGAPAACLITALASAIPAGNTLQMRQKDPHWTVKSILWIAIIGDSGSNKSATLNTAMLPLEAVETAWRTNFAMEKRAYDAEIEAKKQRGAKKEAVGSEAITREASTADDIFAGQVEPRWRRKIIKNATTEATAKLLAENPAGLLYHCDELSSMIGGMDAYKARSGADRPFWLVAKEGKGHSVDRKSSGPLIIENCAVSILGGIQPDKIKPLVSDLASDGLLQRFLPIFLKRFGDGEDDYPDQQLDATISGLAPL
jgi:hypothetical protein